MRRICATGNPVEWSLGAEADVGVKVGAWQEKAWFKGGGIGASIRL